MKDYSIYPIKEDGASLWVVKETATEQVIDKFFYKEDAVAQMKFLNRGGAFAGFTPAFMLRKMPIKLDDAFDQEFART